MQKEGEDLLVRIKYEIYWSLNPSYYVQSALLLGTVF